MRVMVLIKATAQSEAGEMPDEKLLEEMGRFNETLVEAGVLVAGEGLKPSSAGKRVELGDEEPFVMDGPFVETKELLAGFWIWQVASMDEAVAWAKRCPNPMPGQRSQLELRPVFEVEDFGEMTPELKQKEEDLRRRTGQ